MRTVLGFSLVATPFIIVGVMVFQSLGWIGILQVYGSTAVLAGCIFGGVYLLADS